MAVLFKGNSGPVTSITNFFSAGGVSTPQSIAASTASNTKETLYGAAMTAATLYPFHSFTGRGRVNILTAYCKDATSRTIRVKITIDGTVVFDATSSAIAFAGAGVVAIGALTNASGAQVFQPIDYQTSCLIEVAGDSGGSETDKIATGINHEVWA